MDDAAKAPAAARRVANNRAAIRCLIEVIVSPPSPSSSCASSVLQEHDRRGVLAERYLSGQKRRHLCLSLPTSRKIVPKPGAVALFTQLPRRGVLGNWPPWFMRCPARVFGLSYNR